MTEARVAENGGDTPEESPSSVTLEDPAATQEKPWRSEEYSLALASRVVSCFALPRPVEVFEFGEKGNINQDTFLVEAGLGAERREYLLQRINEQVFTRPDTVMTAMVASLDAQRASLEAGRLPDGREWEVITLVPTTSGAPYLAASDYRGSAHWRLMEKIQDCETFKSLSEVEAREQQVSIAEEAGRGLAQYGDFTASVDVSQLVSPLPGYRETDVYFDQFQSVLKGSRDLAEAQPFLPKVPTLRQSTQRHFYLHLDDKEFQRRIGDPELQHFIQLVEREREFGMTLVDSRRSGRIRTVAIHGDTKLDNFLFSTRSGQAKALVDLDTIMPNTWLADWGDMSRSLTNVAGEKERDLARVQVDMEIYEALVRGFLLTAEEVTKDEVALMVASVELITLELGVRFLADYLRGDSYFVLGPTDAPDLNKVRAMAQLTLFERLRDRAGDAQACVDRYLAERRVQ